MIREIIYNIFMNIYISTPCCSTYLHSSSMVFWRVWSSRGYSHTTKVSHASINCLTYFIIWEKWRCADDVDFLTTLLNKTMLFLCRLKGYFDNFVIKMTPKRRRFVRWRCRLSDIVSVRIFCYYLIKKKWLNRSERASN